MWHCRRPAPYVSGRAVDDGRPRMRHQSRIDWQRRGVRAHDERAAEFEVDVWMEVQEIAGKRDEHRVGRVMTQFLDEEDPVVYVGGENADVAEVLPRNGLQQGRQSHFDRGGLNL